MPTERQYDHVHTNIYLKNVLSIHTFSQAVVSVTMYTLMLSPKNALSIHTFTQAVASNLCLDHGQVLVDMVFTEGQQIRSTTALLLCCRRVTTRT